MSEKSGSEAAQGAVFLVGLYEGLLPFVSKLFDWRPFLSLPLRLPGPWWWIVSALVIVAAIVALAVLDRPAKPGA